FTNPDTVCRLRALAVLPVEMPVLRLQQPRAPRGDRRDALPACFRGGTRGDGRTRPWPNRVDDLFRRRHAVADAALDCAGTTRRDRQALVDRARRRGDAGGQSDQCGSDALSRLSRGVQSLDDAALKELGRLHSAQEALDAVAVARSIFKRYSFDLIYARPRQT